MKIDLEIGDCFKIIKENKRSLLWPLFKSNNIWILENNKQAYALETDVFVLVQPIDNDDYANIFLYSLSNNKFYLLRAKEFEHYEKI